MENILLESVQLTDDEGRTFDKDNESLKYYFNKFNDTYFDGKLAPIPLEWASMTNTFGFFKHRPDMQNRKIVPICIKLNKNACGNYADFRNTFVHEMLHYYVDCYIGLPEENWNAAIIAAKFHDKARLNRALRCTAELCHEFDWKRLAIELSEKYPELGNIERYVVKNNETGIGQYDKQYIGQWCMKNVILRRTNLNGARAYIIVSKNNKDYLTLQNALAKGSSPWYRYIGKWERIWPTLDPAKFELYRVSRDFTRGYNKIADSMIRKVDELGEVKSEEL